MSGLQGIYDRSPRFLQTLMLNYVSWRNLRQRRAGKYAEYLDRLLRFQWADRETIRLWQQERFRQVYSQAAKAIPFYRELFAGHGFDPAGFKGVEDLQGLPSLSKEDMRETPECFANDTVRAAYEAHTGGSTGAPMATPWDEDSLQWTFAIMDRFYLNSGVDYFTCSAHLSGNPVAPRRERRQFGRYSYIDKTLYLSIHHLKDEYLWSFFEELKQRKILWLDGYTSFIHEIAQWINANDLSGNLQLSAVFPTSEMVTDEIRATIGRAFACPVFNHYGSTEGAALITECPAGNMHVVPEAGFVEFLREDGTSAPAGERAEMVVTNLRNWCRPLLRFRIGDHAVWSDEACPCGRAWQVVKEISGRRAEFIKTPDGRSLSHFSHLIFKMTTQVKRSQIIQEQLDRFVVKIVKGPGYDQAEEDLIRNRFFEVLGCEADLSIEYVEHIERLPSGKRPTVICRVGD